MDTGESAVLSERTGCFKGGSSEKECFYEDNDIEVIRYLKENLVA